QVVPALCTQTTANPADITATCGMSVADVNFGDRQQQQQLTTGQTATIGFWANRGQTLIKTFGKTATGQALGDWLATSFNNLFGNLAGYSNTQVASFFIQLKGAKSKASPARVQALAVALNIYATTSSL